MQIASSAPLSSGRHAALAAMLWPQRAGQSAAIWRAIALIAVGAVLLTASAKFNLPLPLVPMTLQTLVVLLIGTAYGARLGGATVLAYLAAGALGLPVFAGPVGGLAPLTGPTAGYLAGFVVAAVIVGWFAERGWDRSVPRLFVAMALGHVAILALGFGWLAYGLHLGAAKAWSVGVVPFLAGALVKNALGAAMLPAVRRLVDGRRG